MRTKKENQVYAKKIRAMCADRSWRVKDGYREFLAKMAPILGLPIEGSLDLFDSVFHEMLEDGERRLALEEFREFLAARLVFSHGLDE